MVRRDELVQFLDQELRSHLFQDACPNGLQVYGQPEVSRVATCPSVSYALFEQAQQNKVDTILVHHGLFWEGTTRIVEPYTAQRFKILLENQINLLAYHLPLDAHDPLGNNACLAQMFGLVDCNFQFGAYRGMPIGVMGALPEALRLQSLAEIAATKLDCIPQSFDFSPRSIRQIGIMAGEGGNSQLAIEAKNKGCDLFVCGTLKESTVAVVREIGLAVIALGHYNSEKLGVRALGDHIASRFGIEVMHMDVENPV